MYIVSYPKSHISPTQKNIQLRRRQSGLYHFSFNSSSNEGQNQLKKKKSHLVEYT
jgi:hypothetical protein